MIRAKSSAEGKQKLADWLLAAEVMDIPEFYDCTKAFHNWSHEILNSMDVPWTNGFTCGDVLLFGHKDAPSSIYAKLEAAVEELIIENGVSSFLVGNHGYFDRMALDALRKLKIKYPHINYNVVLAYMPGEKEEWNPYHYSETMLPEGIEGVHPKYAISWRNKWLVAESDIVVAYITHSWGGAAKYVGMATKRGKNVINLGL